ncbi:MAG: hypothetical protein HKL80_11500 [Acidimicrobiales bacterium]|nr:hypothetical protein [Acidimicrobiales bacterium]
MAKLPQPSPADDIGVYKGLRPSPKNKLTDSEVKTIIDTFNSDENVDKPIVQLYYELLDQGIYLASISTIYSIFRHLGQVVDRRRQATHEPKKIPELCATDVNQV